MIEALDTWSLTYIDSNGIYRARLCPSETTITSVSECSEQYANGTLSPETTAIQGVHTHTHVQANATHVRTIKHYHPPFLPTVYSLPGRRPYRITPAVRETACGERDLSSTNSPTQQLRRDTQGIGANVYIICTYVLSGDPSTGHLILLGAVHLICTSLNMQFCARNAGITSEH